MYIGSFKCGVVSCVLLVIHITYPMQTSSQEDPQEGSLLCQLPSDVLYLIAEQLIVMEEDEKPVGWRYVNNLAGTCKLLDRRVNVPLRPITLALGYKRKKEVSVAHFLSHALHMLKRFVGRNEYNPITVNLESNWLADDMDALQHFLEECTKQPIALKLKGLKLWDNELEKLPAAISELTGLEKLNLGYNKLTDEVIAKIVPLVLLECLNMGGNLISKPDPKIIQLQKLKSLNLVCNELGKDALEALKVLKNLKNLSLSANSLTRADIMQSYMTWPYDLFIAASCLKNGDNADELYRQFKKTSRVTICDATYSCS